MRVPISLLRPRRILTIVAAASLTFAVTGLDASRNRPAEGATARVPRICIDRLGVDVALPETRRSLEQAMRLEIERHPRFALAGFQPGRWSIVEGCPAPPALLASGQSHPKAGGQPTFFGLTQQPSGIDLFIFVVPLSDVQRMFGSLPFQVADQEITCRGDVCGAVSSALYLTPETLRTFSAVTKGLAMGLGLDPVMPAPQRQGRQTK